MIHIYDIGNENYDRNGNAVLTPTAGRVTMQGGGAYDISLTLPMDPEGKWRHVVPGAVVKAPVPREVIENSFSGYAADIYKTTGQADLREDKVAPTRINYPQWNAMDMTYTIGSRVSCYGWPHQNYECTYFDNSSPITQVPPYNSAWWKPIADYTPGAAVVVSLPAGSELYWIENAGSGWYKMSTYYGVVGYIQTSAVVFDRHVSETENQPRIITEQLFRLREPSINNETRTVTVTGQHVSYDLAGILCKNITITQASPAMAMGRITENLMMEYRGTIATNLTSEENGTYTGKTNGKNGMFMLLDPDAGIVHAFNAKFTRDNWDVFVMKKSSALSGFRISYAKNMRGVTWKKSSANLVTRVVPVAKNTDGEDLYLPEKWVDSAHIAEYPVVLMELLRISAQVGRDDGTGTDTVWTESALFDYMREKAGERFSVDHADEVVDDLTVQFEPLGDTAEYDWIRPLESVLLYDNIVCQDRDIGLEKVLTVTELEWDPIRLKVTGIRLSNITGAAGRTVTGFNVQNNSITPAKLTEEVTQEIVGQVQALIPDYTDPEAGKYTLPPASSTALGGIMIGFQASGKNYPVALDGNNKAYVYVPWDSGSYTLPLAQDGVRGGIQIGFQASGKNYPVALDGEKAYVYVPWTADGGNAATVGGHTVGKNVPADAVFTDTWRPVQNNLTSTSPSDSLSAAMGKLLSDRKLDASYVKSLDDTNDCNNVTTGGFYSMTGYFPANSPNFTNNAQMLVFDSTGFFKSQLQIWHAFSGDTVFEYMRRSYNGSWGEWQETITSSNISSQSVAYAANAGTVNGHSVNTDVPAGAVFTDHQYTPGTGLSLSNGAFSVRLAYTTSGKDYKVQADNSGNLFVNVPWTADGGNASTVGGHTVATDVPAGAVFTDTWRPVQNNLTSTSTSDSLSAAMGKLLSDRKLDASYVKSLDDTNDCNNVTTGGFYSMTGYFPANSPNFTNNAQMLVFDSTGFFKSQLQIWHAFSGNTVYEYMRRSYNGSWGAWQETITSSNISSQSVAYAANADKVDGYHGVDLLTEVDSQKHRLQIRTGSGNCANNTDTYIPFSTPFSTYCAAVIPVSTSGFNAPNALSIVSNNTNGVTVKQNNAMGVSMNVIVVAFGY